jgi:hypothetical protein
MALDLGLSRIHTGVAAIGHDCNYQFDIMKLGRKRGQQIEYNLRFCINISDVVVKNDG